MAVFVKPVMMLMHYQQQPELNILASVMMTVDH